jgi:hypothetical protein
MGPVMRDLRNPVMEGIFWVAFSFVAYLLTYQFDEKLDQYRYGAAGWPRVLIISMAIFATVQATSKIIKYRRRSRSGWIEAQASNGSSRRPATGILISLKRIGTFVVPLIYLLLMPRIGFYIITPVFVAGYMILLGERRLAYLIGTTLMIFALTMIIFTKLLFVPLPVGNWPGFYEINSLFLSLVK